MELTPQERALLECYLRAKPGPGGLWIVALVLGALVFLGSLVAALCARGDASLWLFALVGLLVMAHALDLRRRALLVSIIQKLYRAEDEGGTAAGRPDQRNL